MAALRRDGILKAVRGNKKKIRSFGVKRIGLFGSYVRGEQKRGSDVDLLVEFEKGTKTFDNYMGAKFFLEDLLGRRVDLVISESVKPLIRPHIMKEVLYA
jgi:uncharacterized protein